MSIVYKLLIAISLLLLFPFFVAAQFQFYNDEDHLVDQEVIATADGGYLIASLEYCYTPGSIVIEGCPKGLNLIKLNNQMDTMWMKNVPTYYFTLHGIYENIDGGYTIYTTEASNYVCGNIIMGGPFGWSKVHIYHIDSEGDYIDQSSFPNECSLSIHGMGQLTDSTFIVAGYYVEPDFSPNPYREERLFIMGANGTIIDQNVSPFVRYWRPETYFDEDQLFNIFYLDVDSTARQKTYDVDLNLVEDISGANLSQTVFYTSGIREYYPHWSSDGTLSQLIHFPFDTFQNSNFIVFDENLELVSENVYTFSVETPLYKDGDTYLLGTTKEYEDKDVVLLSFNELGDSLSERRIEHLGNETPRQIRRGFVDSVLFIVGTFVSTDTSDLGPSEVFLYTDEVASSVAEEDKEIGWRIEVAPNPVHDVLSITLQDASLNQSIEFQLYNSLGQLNKTFSGALTTTFRVDLSGLDQGIYFLVGIDAISGTRFGTVKIIKD